MVTFKTLLKNSHTGSNFTEILPGSLQPWMLMFISVPVPVYLLASLSHQQARAKKYFFITQKALVFVSF